jgi:ArsR family transcriptional regulator
MVAATTVEASTPVLGTEAQAALLSTVADPNRLAVLNALATGTTCVCDLQVRVPIAANLLSYHLKVLREAGLIVGVRRGRWIDYSLTEGALDRLHAAVPTASTAPVPPAQPIETSKPAPDPDGRGRATTDARRPR